MSTSFVKIRLGAMMFLQYVIWGAWYVTLNTYLTRTLGFSGTQAGALFGTPAGRPPRPAGFLGARGRRFFAPPPRPAGAVPPRPGLDLVLSQVARLFPGDGR